MRILVTNDDGIYAPGLWRLVEALRQAGEVWVVAPDREQSGVGTSLTLHHPVRIQGVAPPLPGIPAYAVEGTPGDAVVLALGNIVKEGADLVVAGINEGANLGNDVFISGTVGAAFHGYFHDLPSLALSVTSQKDLHKDLHFETAAQLALLLIRRIAQGALPQEMLLNINLPNLPLGEIKGIEVTTLARRGYSDFVQEVQNGRRNYYWIVRGRPEEKAAQGTDLWAVREKKVSITPLRAGPGTNKVADALRELAPGLFQELRALGGNTF